MQLCQKPAYCILFGGCRWSLPSHMPFSPACLGTNKGEEVYKEGVISSMHHCHQIHFILPPPPGSSQFPVQKCLSPSYNVPPLPQLPYIMLKSSLYSLLEATSIEEYTFFHGTDNRKKMEVTWWSVKEGQVLVGKFHGILLGINTSIAYFLLSSPWLCMHKYMYIGICMPS